MSLYRKLANYFQLSKAIRNGDPDMFFEIYDNLRAEDLMEVIN